MILKLPSFPFILAIVLMLAGGVALACGGNGGGDDDDAEDITVGDDDTDDAVDDDEGDDDEIVSSMICEEEMGCLLETWWGCLGGESTYSSCLKLYAECLESPSCGNTVLDCRSACAATFPDFGQQRSECVYDCGRGSAPCLADLCGFDEAAFADCYTTAKAAIGAKWDDECGTSQDNARQCDTEFELQVFECQQGLF
ncbi:hypothetical protein KDL45_01720 [bacterium]|nr:hypothetical protein [bacterium]